jgi:hypothetical protein
MTSSEVPPYQQQIIIAFDNLVGGGGAGGWKGGGCLCGCAEGHRGVECSAGHWTGSAATTAPPSCDGGTEQQKAGCAAHRVLESRAAACAIGAAGLCQRTLDHQHPGGRVQQAVAPQRHAAAASQAASGGRGGGASLSRWGAALRPARPPQAKQASLTVEPSQEVQAAADLIIKEVIQQTYTSSWDEEVRQLPLKWDGPAGVRVPCRRRALPRGPQPRCPGAWWGPALAVAAAGSDIAAGSCHGPALARILPDTRPWGSGGAGCQS